jgi:hypothetical protein
MPKLQGKELSDLYPKPKTYDQLKAEREQAQLARKPRLVAPKIALWSTATLLTVRRLFLVPCLPRWHGHNLLPLYADRQLTPKNATFKYGPVFYAFNHSRHQRRPTAITCPKPIKYLPCRAFGSLI